MGPGREIPWELPSLSNTTFALDSTMDKTVSNHAVSVIENWLHHFPTVHIPNDDDFKALATLTRLEVETVRIWFGQRLRKQPTEPLVPSSSSIYLEGLPSMNISDSQSFSGPVAAQSIVQIPIPPAQPAVLREAARWVRQRGAKCILNPESELLRRYCGWRKGAGQVM